MLQIDEDGRFELPRDSRHNQVSHANNFISFLRHNDVECSLGGRFEHPRDRIQARRWVSETGLRLRVDDDGKFELPRDVSLDDFTVNEFEVFLHRYVSGFILGGRLENPSNRYKTLKLYDIWTRQNRRSLQILSSLILLPFSLHFILACIFIISLIIIEYHIHTPPAGTDARPVSFLSKIDDILKTLHYGNIAFAAPKSMRFEDEGSVRLLLSPGASIKELKDGLTKTFSQQDSQTIYNIDVNRIKVSDVMEAKLNSRGFEIQSLTPERQPVGTSEETQWVWSISPKESGRQELRLSINAIIIIDTKELPRAIKVFDRTIVVQISFWHWLKEFIGKNWQWLFGGIVAIAGVAYRWLVPRLGGLYGIGRWLKRRLWRPLPKHTSPAVEEISTPETSTNQTRPKSRRDRKKRR